MLKRSIGFLSKANAAHRASLTAVRASSSLFKNLPKANFGSIWQNNASHQFKNVSYLRKCGFASQPSHQKLAMPALSPTMEQGNILKWNYKEGDKVSAGDQICDIETDKATLGFEMQDEGYIAKILVEGGARGVKVGQPIVILVEDEADVKAFSDYKEASSEGQDAGQKQASSDSKNKDDKVSTKGYEKDHHEVSKTRGQPEAQGKSDSQRQQEQRQQDKNDKITTKGYEKDHHHIENSKGVARNNVRIRFTHGNRSGESQGQRSASHGERVHASPYARKLAADKGIDLSQVQGSGPNGRVLAHDVENYKPKPKTETTSEKPKSQEKAPEKEKPKSQQSSATASNPYTDTPLAQHRAEFAQSVFTSKTTIPHYYLKAEVLTEKATGIIAELNKDAKNQVNLNDLIVKAASLACREVPESNSQWHGQYIRKFKNVDISVTVDTGAETFTPVIQGVDTKGLSEIAKATNQFSEKANNNQLKPEDQEGGTFTVTNLGTYGLSRFTPIIIPPQSCSLAVGKLGKKVIPDGDGYKEVSVIEVTLSCDHRVIDGAVGAKWLQSFKNYLEKPLTMLL